MTTTSPNPIILYDGVCGLCNRWIQFVLKRDAKDQFRFAALQSEFARRILQRHGATPEQLDTFYVVNNLDQQDESVLSRSDAAIFVLKQLGGVSRATAFLLLSFPKWLRNRAYDLLARNRYRLFGRHQTCVLPEPDYRHKMVGS